MFVVSWRWQFTSYVIVDVELVPSFQHGHQDAGHSPRMMGQPQILSKERNLYSPGSLTFNNRLQVFAQVYRGYHSFLDQ